MRRAIVLILLLVIVSKASALSYEEKPNVTAFISGSNHLTRGDYKTIYVTIYNPAERKKVDYFDEEEATFFSKNEDMIFTAYNVKIELLGNDYIHVKTSPQFIPALPPMNPVTLPFVVKVSEDAKAGKYELVIKVEFDRIDHLLYLDTYAPGLVPTQKTIFGANETTTYEYEILPERYKIQYDHESMEIKLPIYVEEKEVKLEIVNVSAENMVGKGKGKLVVEVKNVGEKTGKNAYIVLETPSGFKASALSLSQPSAPSMMPSATSSAIPPAMSMPSAVPAMAMPPQPSAIPPSQPAYYVGELKPGETAKAIFYVRTDVKDEGNYTFKVKAIYLNEYGNIVESDPVPFGVHVKKLQTSSLNLWKARHSSMRRET